MRTLNILAISLFLASLIIFNIFLVTQFTSKVLIYFIPDMTLVLANLIMTFVLINRENDLVFFLSNKVIKFLIALGYYINILSAFFYLFLFMDNKWIHSGALKFFNNLWIEFNDIMKFKVTATLHALAFKYYADILRQSLPPHID